MLELMQMARASEADIEAATVIEGILSDVDRGLFPRLPTGGYQENDPTLFDPENPQHLGEFFKRIIGCTRLSRGGVGRVVWGYQTMISNNLVDPEKDYLAIHPRIERALEVYGLGTPTAC